MLHQFVVQLHIRSLSVFTYIKLNDQHGMSIASHRMYMLHSFDVRNNFFQRFYYSTFDFFWTSSRIATITSAIGMMICGSSSLGINEELYTPMIINANINKIVSLESINAEAILPDIPLFIFIFLIIN